MKKPIKRKWQQPAKLTVYYPSGVSATVNRIPRNTHETPEGTFAEFTFDKKTITGELTPKGWTANSER